MKRLVCASVLAALALAVLAGGAGAKGFMSLEVCGPAACNDVALPDGPRYHDLGGTGVGFGGAPEPGDYYLLRISVGERRGHVEGTMDAYVIPADGAFRMKDAGETWVELDPAYAGAVREAARGLDPFPAPELVDVTVAGHHAADPQAYTALFETHEPGVPVGGGPVVKLELTWDRDSPWSYARFLDYEPRERSLLREDGFVTVPDGLAGRLDREAAGLPPVEPDAFPWWGALATALGATALATALVLLFRRRRRAALAAVAAGMFLVVAAPAQAKEITSVALCGPGGCQALDPAALRAFTGDAAAGPLSTASAPPVGPWYRLRIGYAHDPGRSGFVQDLDYVPATGAVRDRSDPGAWTHVRARQRASLHALERKVRPYPAPQLAAVLVNGRRLAATPALLALAGPLHPVVAPAYRDTPVSVELRWRGESPWAARMDYLPVERVLIRLDGWARVPPALALLLR